MTMRSIGVVISGFAMLALGGQAVAQSLNYAPPGAAYVAFKSQMEDKKNLINGLYNQTHIRSTIKKSLRDADVGSFAFTSRDSETDGPVVNGVLVAPTATVEGDLNVFIDLDGDTLVLTE